MLGRTAYRDTAALQPGRLRREEGTPSGGGEGWAAAEGTQPSAGAGAGERGGALVFRRPENPRRPDLES